MGLLERLIIPDEMPPENWGGFNNARERDQCVIFTQNWRKLEDSFANR